MAVTEQDVVEALRGVKDPDVFKDLVAIGAVKGVKIFEGTVAVELSTASPQKEKIRADVEAAVRRIAGVEEIFVSFATPLGTSKAATGGSQKTGHAPPAKKPLANVKHIIAVGAGKGGVGKSMVAVNLAVGLALAGKRVGLLDGDIYGPSIPTMVGISPRPPEVVGEKIIPFTVKSPDAKISIGVMSIGFMVDKEKALIWRGPMAHGAMKQFLEQVEWGGPSGEGLDYLIVDLPPGTGDVALTLAQTVPLTGAVIVATPQEVALSDARRAVRMFQQLGVEILGVVENMSYFVCDHGTAYDIFGRGGAQIMAQQMGLPFLGEIPIVPALRVNSDEGKPFDNFAGDGKAATPLKTVVDMLDKQVAVRVATRPVAKAIDLRIS